MTTDKYTKEPGYIYIETEEDRIACSPKQQTDEYLFGGRWRKVGDYGLNIMNERFSMLNVYRRKVATGAVAGDWRPVVNWRASVPSGITDDTHWLEILYQSGSREVVLVSSINVAGSYGSHYRFIPKVPIPAAAANSQPPADPVYDAYCAWVSGPDCTSDEPKDAWAAGVAWAREQAANE